MLVEVLLQEVVQQNSINFKVFDSVKNTLNLMTSRRTAKDTTPGPENPDARKLLY